MLPPRGIDTKYSAGIHRGSSTNGDTSIIPKGHIVSEVCRGKRDKVAVLHMWKTRINPVTLLNGDVDEFRFNIGVKTASEGGVKWRSRLNLVKFNL